MKRLPKIKKKLRWAVLFLAIMGCVDRFDFDAPPTNSITVIEGMISDQPEPYEVKISNAIPLDADSTVHTPISGAAVTLFDDVGNSENLVESASGTYITQGNIQGQVGHKYYIRVKMPDGSIFESTPDEMNPVGEIEQIRYEFEARTVEMPWGDVQANVFNVFVDSDSGPGDDVYVRWRYTGTFKIDTRPDLHETYTPPYTPYKDPPPCSGYVVIPGPTGSGGLLEKVGECTCCTCWVRNYENVPQLSDDQLINNGKFANIKVGEIPIDPAAFNDRYMIEVSQLSLTRNTFEFFKLIRNQKVNASNLFQPPFGELTGNFRTIKGNTSVVGIFWSASKRTRTLFLDQSNIPYPIVPVTGIWEACFNLYSTATTQKPPLWQ